MGLWLIFMGPCIILALIAQMMVKSAYAKYSRVGVRSGLTGAQAAAHMLHGMGLEIVETSEQAKRMKNAVAIQSIRGFLTDHYDPRERVLRLSPDVYNGRSLAAVGIACHEAGHALQHAEKYAPLELRNVMVPTAQLGSWMAFPLIIIGGLMSSFMLIKAGIVLFAIIVAFQIVTLPVEFNASRRAKKALVQLGIVAAGGEQKGVAAVLNAAALTYVAAAISAAMQLLYYLAIFTGGSRR